MRYLPLNKRDRAQMLEAIGVSDINDFYQNVPKESVVNDLVDLPLHKGEIEVESILSDLAKKNKPASEHPFFLGAGCYNHHIPASVDHIIQRSEFLTAYTPYQPEISQGTLTTIFEFQTMICMLTGQEVANASMYDGSTSVAEAALMSLRVNKKRKNIHVAGNLDPQYRAVLETYVSNYEGVDIKNSEPDTDAACVIVQTPDYTGEVVDIAKYRKKCDETGALLIVAISEIVSLGLLPEPVQADIVAGEAGSIGVPMSFGGPHLGFFASKLKYVRQMPGRICGQTVDKKGRRSFVLTLNTREQHIRREKATSNICTNQGLCATAFTVHMALLGEDGLRKLARINHEKACKLADALEKIDSVHIVNETFFNEFVIKLPKDSNYIVSSLLNKNITAGLPLEGGELLVAVTEMTSDSDIEYFVQALNEELK